MTKLIVHLRFKMPHNINKREKPLKEDSLNSSLLIKAQIALSISAFLGLSAVIGIVFFPFEALIFPLIIVLTILLGLSTVVAILFLIRPYVSSSQSRRLSIRGNFCRIKEELQNKIYF